MTSREDVSYSLIRAVREGSLGRVRELINSYGLSYSTEWANGYVLLCDALKAKRGEIAKLLLTSGSKVNSKRSQVIPCDTALHLALRFGDKDIVEMILDKGADVDAQNQSGDTPLHIAILNRKLEFTRLILRHRPDVNARNKEGVSLLHVAARLGCFETVEHLLEHGALVNCTCFSCWKKNYTPLHFAIESGHTGVVDLLLSAGAKVDTTVADYRTPLHIAAERGHTRIAEELLKFGACIHSVTLEKLFTPLHLATNAGRKAVVKLLLQHGAKVDDQDTDGNTTLYLAVEKGCLTIVEDLLKYCPDINNQSNQKSLKIAVRCCGGDYQKIVEAIFEYGITVNPEDANDPTLIISAVENGYLTIVVDLLKYGGNVNTITYYRVTLLHSAVKNKHEEVVELLISYDADINARDKAGKTPIFYAVQTANAKITKLLLTNGANVKSDPDLLNIAVEKLCMEIVEVLLQHDVDVKASDIYGRTALHFTAFSESERTSGSRIIKGLDIAIRGEIAQLLLNEGANINAQMKNGATTLHGAAQKGYAKLAEALLEYNGNANYVGDGDIRPLLSARRGNEEISAMLSNKGADVNAKQQDGFTALHFAIEEKHEVVVKLLLEHGAKVDCKTRDGITPLLMAVEYGTEEIIQTILKFGADIDHRDERGRTALHVASAKGHLKVVANLLDYGSDINITTRDDFTPLDYGTTEMRSCRRRFDYHGYRNAAHRLPKWKETAEVLQCHLVKMKTANLYVSEKNLQLMSRRYETNGFREKCEEEIAGMKSEKIHNANISFYDILIKRTSSLAIYMRNENIVQVLESDDYKKKFPIYAGMIESHFRKSMERKELLERGNDIFHLLFPDLPYDCTEKIFRYLSDEDLRILIDASKLFGFSNSDTNTNDVMITSNVSQVQCT